MDRAEKRLLINSSFYHNNPGKPSLNSPTLPNLPVQYGRNRIKHISVLGLVVTVTPLTHPTVLFLALCQPRLYQNHEFSLVYSFIAKYIPRTTKRLPTGSVSSKIFQVARKFGTTAREFLRAGIQWALILSSAFIPFGNRIAGYTASISKLVNVLCITVFHGADSYKMICYRFIIAQNCALSRRSC